MQAEGGGCCSGWGGGWQVQLVLGPRVRLRNAMMMANVIFVVEAGPAAGHTDAVDFSLERIVREEYIKTLVYSVGVC